MQVGQASDWTVEATADRTITATHRYGHVIVFGFSGDSANEIEIRSRRWAFDCARDEELRSAAAAARVAARAKGWMV